MRRSRQTPSFTHFCSLPFIRPYYRYNLSQLQNKITQIFTENKQQGNLKPCNPNLFHLTISMLTMPHNKTKQKLQTIIKNHTQNLQQIMSQVKLTTNKIKYFTFPNKSKTIKNSISVIYLDITKDNEMKKVLTLTDYYIRTLLKQQIIHEQELKNMHISYNHNLNKFNNSDPHITLFRCEGVIENQQFIQFFKEVQDVYLGHVLQCDLIDISTRGDFDDSQFYTPLYRIHLNTNQKMGQNQ